MQMRLVKSSTAREAAYKEGILEKEDIQWETGQPWRIRGNSIKREGGLRDKEALAS